MTIPYEFQCRQNGKQTTVRIDAFAVARCNHCGELVIDYEADEQVCQAASLNKPRADDVSQTATATSPQL